MKNEPLSQLSRREREIMDVVYRLGEADVHDVVEKMGEDLSYDTVRVTLSILEKKGLLKHSREGRRYVYHPTVSREKASQHAARNLVQTFFGGSPSKAILAMIDMSTEELSEKDLEEIAGLIEKGRKP